MTPGDIDGSGALMSARQANLQLTAEGADLTNISGTVAGREVVHINAQSINNLFGRIASGEVALNARQDINIVGATVEAQRSLTLDAGRDINMSSTLTTTRASAQHREGDSVAFSNSTTGGVLHRVLHLDAPVTTSCVNTQHSEGDPGTCQPPAAGCARTA